MKNLWLAALVLLVACGSTGPTADPESIRGKTPPGVGLPGDATSRVRPLPSEPTPAMAQGGTSGGGSSGGGSGGSPVVGGSGGSAAGGSGGLGGSPAVGGSGGSVLPRDAGIAPVDTRVPDSGIIPVDTRVPDSQVISVDTRVPDFGVGKQPSFSAVYFTPLDVSLKWDNLPNATYLGIYKVDAALDGRKVTVGIYALSWQPSNRYLVSGDTQIRVTNPYIVGGIIYPMFILTYNDNDGHAGQLMASVVPIE